MKRRSTVEERGNRVVEVRMRQEWGRWKKVEGGKEARKRRETREKK
jgi:hypothetical protein